MDKRSIHRFFSIGCFVVCCGFLCGCSNMVGDGFSTSQNAPLKLLIKEFSQKGPQTQLKEWEADIMQPALALEVKLAQPQGLDIAKALQQVRSWQARLHDIEPVKLTDAYLHFSKEYLAGLERLLLERQKTGQFDAKSMRKLEDARLAFLNVQSEVFRGKGTYRLKELKDGELQLGISYEHIRRLLAMPATCLEPVEVQGEVHKPTLWAHGERFLYVDFVDDKAVLIKLHVNPYLGKKKDKKLVQLISKYEDAIMQPTCMLYNEYIQTRNNLQVKQSDKEAVARALAPWLAVNLPKIKAYQQQLIVIPEDNRECIAYVQYAKAYMAFMVENLELLEGLPKFTQNQAKLEEILKRNDLLEDRLIPEASFVYANARGLLLENKGTFQFPQYMFEELPKRPWQMAIEHWARMPGELVQSWNEYDKENVWNLHTRKIYVWAVGEEFLIGEFLDERLEKWKLQRLNDGFWYGR